jgi:hypothetical protein
MGIMSRRPVERECEKTVGACQSGTASRVQKHTLANTSDR